MNFGSKLWLVLVSFAALLATALFFGWNEFAGFRILLAVYLMLAGYRIAQGALACRPLDAILLSPLLISLLFTIGGAVIFYFFKFDSASTAILLFLPSMLTYIGSKKERIHYSLKTLSWKSTVLLILSFLTSIITILVLFSSQTIQTTLGPWEAIHPLFFFLLFLNASLIVVSILLCATEIFTVFAITGFFFSFISVLAFVYPLGFGFDPILHAAAQKLLADLGFLSPKTPYYSGQYGLIATLSIVFKVHPEILQRFLVIGLAALTVPLLAWRSACVFGFSRSIALFGSFVVLAITPLTPLTSLTPWGYAFLGSIVTILASVLFLKTKNKGWMMIFLVSCIAALAIHPLAGLPLIGFVLAVPFYAYRSNHWSVDIFSLLTSMFSIPAAFIMLSIISPHIPLEFKQFDPQSLLSLIKQFVPLWETRFSALLDPTYFISSVISLLLLLSAIHGINVIYRRGKHAKIIQLLMLGFAGTIGSYLITSGFLSFPSLPLYEQGIYADRIREVAMLFLVPASICSLCSIGEQIQKQKKFLLFIFVLCISGIFTIRAYTLYPHNDAFVAYHGYTISQNDIDAVKWIDADARGQEYIVLANQVVSAASIKILGFKKYYTISVDKKPTTFFYYSIPATSPLHNAFVQMLNEPSRKIAESAMERIGVKNAYFVVTNYEPRFRNVLEKAKKTADGIYPIDTDTVTVFRYVKHGILPLEQPIIK